MKNIQIHEINNGYLVVWSIREGDEVSEVYCASIGDVLVEVRALLER